MIKIKKILLGLTVCGCLLLKGEKIEASSNENKTIFDVNQATIYNDNDLIYIVDDNVELFTAKPVDKFVYTTARLNIRDIPTINSNPVGVLPKNSKIHLVGESEVGWSIIQIEGTNFFAWSEYLTTDEINEDIVEVKTLDSVKAPKADTTTYSAGRGGAYLGRYSLTAYCACSSCCGAYANGITASGTVATQGRTVACNSLKMGTRIIINGNTYTVEDTGGMGGNVIDIFFNSHSEALSFGLQSADVYLAE